MSTPSHRGPRAASAAERAWQEKHDALEAEIVSARERRAASRRRRAEERARAFGDLCEASEGRAVAWRRGGATLADMLAFAGGDVWLLQTLARWLRAESTRRIARLRHAARRPEYYERERARRQELAAARRRTARRTTENPCPTREQILDAWLKVGDSNEDLLRFGSLIEDLACYVDSSLIRTEDGAIVGRRGGVKAWLQTNIPALYLKYTTVMRYKAAAKKLRQLTGLADPVPAARLVDDPPPTDGGTPPRPRGEGKELEKDYGADKFIELLRARAVYLEIVADPPRSRTAFLDRIDAYCDPERVEEATTLAHWRERYRCEITVRTKTKWLERLWRIAG